METLARRHHVTEIPPTPRVFSTELAALFAGVESRPNEPGNLFRIAIAAEHRAAGLLPRARGARARGGSADQRQCLQLAAEEHEHAQTLSAEFRLWRERVARGTAPSVQPAAPLPAPGVAFINAAQLLLAQADAGAHRARLRRRSTSSYRELRARVARAAGAWRQRGLRPGDRVAVKLPDGFDWVVAFLGAIWAGGIAVRRQSGMRPRPIGSTSSTKPASASSWPRMPTTRRRRGRSGSSRWRTPARPSHSHRPSSRCSCTRTRRRSGATRRAPRASPRPWCTGTASRARSSASRASAWASWPRTASSPRRASSSRTRRPTASSRA